MKDSSGVKRVLSVLELRRACTCTRDPAKEHGITRTSQALPRDHAYHLVCACG